MRKNWQPFEVQINVGILEDEEYIIQGEYWKDNGDYFHEADGDFKITNVIPLETGKNIPESKYEIFGDIYSHLIWSQIIDQNGGV